MGCCNSLFSLQVADDKIIDLRASFSPTSLPILLFKFLCFAATITAAVFFFQLVYDDEDKLQYVYYFAYFTVWGLLCAALYFVTSFLNSWIPLRQCNNAIDRPSYRAKWTWVVFEVAAHTEMTVTVLYWTLLWPQEREDDEKEWWEDVGNVLAHGGVMILVLITGLVINRVPVRLSHYIIPFTVDACYLGWTLLHDTLGMGNGQEGGEGDNGGGDDDKAIYTVIDWVDNFQKTALLAAFVLFVVSPALWIVLWLISLCGRKTMTVNSYPCSRNSDYASGVGYANEQVGRKKNRQRRWG